ncbi:hypothetical protein ARTSIC4J27_959 [Pseudarthrobacter siccitolerans]|uniref:Uncharacterized protein n=1 Tax=Pseudarthrobacter siccitolerans TaxID=861266 RepID=A0A024GZK1_9MICC|nr:hypothetical protein ARTSIC4J27_959 [Pseudarthrobacter siccitolerans]
MPYSDKQSRYSTNSIEEVDPLKLPLTFVCRAVGTAVHAFPKS